MRHGCVENPTLVPKKLKIKKFNNLCSSFVTACAIIVPEQAWRRPMKVMKTVQFVVPLLGTTFGFAACASAEIYYL